MITILFFLIPTIHAAEMEYTLDPIVVKASSSFDSLGEDAFLPQKKISFEAARSTTQNVLDKTQMFPSKNLGFPSGAQGSNLGGRSSEDSQVSTLGVPLTLPQGGGPDLSIFPSYLWSGASISTVPTIAGFSPQGVSGSMQLELWTRSQIRELKKSTSISRITGSVDRQLQNFSVATKKDTSALMAGMNFGQQKGPAGSLSMYAIRKPRSHLLFHLLGSDQDGDNPGSKTFPSPNGRKKFWRVIPALESHQEFGEEESKVVLENTAYADLQQLKIEGTSSNTHDRTQQFGVENAVHWNDSTFALTARYVNYQSSTFGTVDEWPIITQVSRDINLNDFWKMKIALGGNYTDHPGFAPTARFSFKNTLSNESNFFYELNSLVKMPTLTARYYHDSTFTGNPNLEPERVSSLIGGYDTKKGSLESTTTVKAEFRNKIQVTNSTYTSTINAGNAYLLSMAEDFGWKVSPSVNEKVGLLLSYSNLIDTNLPYPDLPNLSLASNGTYSIIPEVLNLNRSIRFMGPSTTSSGKTHDSYLLMDLSVDYLINKTTALTLGCDNITDNRAEVVVDFPLPGRIVYLNFVSSFE
jgi:hypothetical protein